MRSTFLRYAALFCFPAALSLAAGTALAQPRNKAKKESESGDKTLEKQMAWENKVMGDDGGKQADLKKIAAAKKLADEARRNPEPLPPPKVKDPNKEGVRAKQEASIGLAIDSDKAPTRKAVATKKATGPAPSSNDELGALVASSLAEDKASGAAPSASPADLLGGGGSAKAKRGVAAPTAGKTKHARAKVKAKGRAKAVKRKARADAGTGSSLDRMFASAN